MNIESFKDHWALVTGSSSGIGREYAIQLAKAGMNIVLVARRQNVLLDLALNLMQQYNIKIKVYALDLADNNNVLILKQKLEQEGIKIRLLCNNAGIGQWGHFKNTDLEKYQNMINLNNATLVSMCYQFYDHLRYFDTSVIINVSSPAAYQPMPYMAVYAASKAFVHSFSQALCGEWKEHGILVQTVVPGPTKSEFDVNAGAYASSITQYDVPESVVFKSLHGLINEKPVIVVAKGTFIQKIFGSLFPSKIVIREVGKMFKPPKED